MKITSKAATQGNPSQLSNQLKSSSKSNSIAKKEIDHDNGVA
jgi:hypothetical protein